jgi:hypothetical protein
MIENRKAYRLPFRTKFVFGTQSRVSTGNTLNISAGGLFVMTLDPLPRESMCRCVFQLSPESTPICIEAQVKRVVAPSAGIDQSPGMGVNFLEHESTAITQVAEFMIANRKNFELAATILASGEPELMSLEPLLSQMHLPPISDLGELRFYVERILKSIELVERNS